MAHRRRYRDRNRVRHWRICAMVTQQELADRAGVHLRTVRNVELGWSRASVRTKRRLLRALGFRVRDIHRVWPLESR